MLRSTFHSRACLWTIFCIQGNLSCYTQKVIYLLFYLLEAIQHWHTRDTVYLAEGDQTDGIQSVLAGHLSKVDYSTGQVVHYQHGLVVLEGGREGGKEGWKGGRGGEGGREGGKGGREGGEGRGGEGGEGGEGREGRGGGKERVSGERGKSGGGEGAMGREVTRRSRGRKEGEKDEGNNNFLV